MINQIGSLNETTLHNDLKWWYSKSNDQLEQKIGNFIIDIVRDDLLIEIQTKNFAAIRNKLEILLQNHKVKLVHPIIQDKWIVNLNTQLNKIIRRRLSPNHFSYISIFNELIRIPTMIFHPNFTIELVLVQIEEIRQQNRNGSRKRIGWSIYDRKLVKVLERKHFQSPSDFLCFVPNNLEAPFTNIELARSLKMSIRFIQKMSYCLRKMGIFKLVGKRSNSYLYDL
ncbi:MAG: hypothetical protein ACFFA3_06780 [Promethearchaeota archaeon]